MPVKKYRIWARWADGFEATVCDRHRTFTLIEAYEIRRKPEVKAIYHNAVLEIREVQE